MTDATAPLVPADVDLRDFAFMPLDVVRLRDSDLAAEESPEACWAALLLWAASWHQIPAGSIPDSDQWQAKQAGYVARGRIDKAWESVRAGALRNWVMCSDGRLYHPVVAEKALTAWAEKQAQRTRTAAATAAREAKRKAEQAARDAERDGQRDEQRDEQRDVERDVHQGRVKGQGEGQGEEKKEPDGSSSAARTGRPSIPCPYAEIVGLYHEILPMLPEVRVLDGKTGEARKKAMREMWGWVLSSTKPDKTRRATTADEAIEWFRAYFTRATDNDFVMNRTQRSPEHKNWRADLDYLMSSAGLKQVIEKTEAAA